MLETCRVEGQGFEFLGYRFEAGQRWVRKKSLMSLRDNIRAKTKRNEGNSLTYVIAALNPTLRGWYGYFQHAHRFTFSSIEVESVGPTRGLKLRLIEVRDPHSLDRAFGQARHQARLSQKAMSASRLCRPSLAALGKELGA